MKTRILSAILALVILVPIFIHGGLIFEITVYILSILGLKEFLAVKNKKKELPTFIKFISYIILGLFLLLSTNTTSVFMIDYRIVAGLFITLLLPAVLYHDRKKYSINDAFYLIGGIFFIAISLSLLLLIRENSLSVFIYLFVIAIMTDTFAYFTGFLIGRHKLLASVSPKKTWEGMIGGTVFGTFIGVMFYVVVINPTISLPLIIIATLFLSIIGQFGDLVFSSIKRHFNVKDFSNIMPGHGGVLDRLDSIIFIMLGFTFFIGLL
ncbi:MAG: CDP-archaeol synthase [Bacilli bacterium]